MKTETVTIQVRRYMDEDGEPICGDCKICPYVFFRVGKGCIPSSTCPVWHNTVKHKWPTFEEWAQHEWESSRRLDDEINADEAFDAARE